MSEEWVRGTDSKWHIVRDGNVLCGENSGEVEKVEQEVSQHESYSAMQDCKECCQNSEVLDE